jgi:NAD(P)-dependent dehydrogenase (short-subunit alcohol dehydrogenase family)
MPLAEPSALLRPGLLEGVAIVLAGAVGPNGGELGFAGATGALCAGLGARIALCEGAGEGAPEDREVAADDAVVAALGELGGAGVLIVDVAGLFERASATDALAEALQGAWELTRALANRAFIPQSAGGRIVLLAPRSARGTGHTAAAAAGLENLARTLSIEWARYGITIVTLAPGLETTADEVAALCAYLASPAGSYFSGCLLDLTGPRAAGA